MALWRVSIYGEARLARGPVDEGPTELIAASSLGAVLGERGGLGRALQDTAGPAPASATLLAPIDSQEVWAAGVTYLRSRDARMEESTAPDHYDLVYGAERPELFYKTAGWRVRGSGEPVGIRPDSTWDVPEPELALVVEASGAVAGYTLANDVSSRSIEGENPLYLPQAKSYDGSCALGPCIVPIDEAPLDVVIEMTVRRAGATAFQGRVSTTQMKRSPRELVDWLWRGQRFPAGVFLLTGTGIVPGPDFTLQAGDEIEISATGFGRLTNRVEQSALFT